MPSWVCKLPGLGDVHQIRALDDSYTKISLVGAGTYGKVWAACDKSNPQTRVALKRIQIHTARDGFPYSALREVRILSALAQHPNFVTLREVVAAPGGAVDELDEDADNVKRKPIAARAREAEAQSIAEKVGGVYLVLDYVDYDLTGLLESGVCFTESYIKSYMFQLCKALQAMHNLGIVHRDLKCANILLTDNNVLQVADMGLARFTNVGRFAQHVEPITALWDARRGSAAGAARHFDGPLLTVNVITQWYRPPELCLGVNQYGPEVDMWSAGCIMAQMLLGKPIFRGENDVAVLARIERVCGGIGNVTALTALPSWRERKPEPQPQSNLTRYMQEKLRARFSEFSASTWLFLHTLLDVSPSSRASAASAIQHPWFDDLNKLAPNAHLRPLSQHPDIDPCKDYHELAATKRKRGHVSTADAMCAADADSARAGRGVGSGRYTGSARSLPVAAAAAAAATGAGFAGSSMPVEAAAYPATGGARAHSPARRRGRSPPHNRGSSPSSAWPRERSRSRPRAGDSSYQSRHRAW